MPLDASCVSLQDQRKRHPKAFSGCQATGKRRGVRKVFQCSTHVFVSMSGNPAEGAGCVTWWGLSPALDLIDTVCGPARHQGEVSVLLIGSADLRHVLKTIAGQTDGEALHFYIVEDSLDLVARQLLFLSLALEPPNRMGLQEKVQLFLELYGSTCLRSQSAQYLQDRSRELCSFIMESGYADTDSGCTGASLLPCVDLTALKYRDRDSLCEVCGWWGISSPLPLARLWEARLRGHLGSRFDSRLGSFDWDLRMKLHDRGCSVISRSEYQRWREGGVAFQKREGLYESPNHTLVSIRVFKQRADIVPLRGYWGDIVSSPFIAFGVQPDDQTLLTTQNGQHAQTAEDICYHTVESLFQTLSNRGQRSDPTPYPLAHLQSTLGTDHSPMKKKDAKRNTQSDYELLCVDRVRISVLPVGSVSRLQHRDAYRGRFHIIYCSCSMAHQLGAPLREIAAPRASLIVELARYILDLSCEQQQGFTNSVIDRAKEAGFEPVDGSSDVFAHFQLHNPSPATSDP
ncbi:dynein axonemal assembly factor 3 isoform X2 [Amia ocellicauda]|uniref:dynein axonemal assembly factor 3 isoform X2 n=1 Tax=Amia ocellicauda TaxID=2972642 RepID=UPI003463AEAB